MNESPTDRMPGPEEGSAEGIVIRSTGSWHEVELAGEVVPSRVPGKGRLEDKRRTNPVAVGDRVEVELNEDGTGQIVSIAPRLNKLSRRAAGRRSGLEHVIAANVDLALVVQSAALPRFNPGFVDRLLVMAQVGGIGAGLIINKIDLLNDDESRRNTEFWRDLYSGLGYPVFETCAVSGEGVDLLAEALEAKTTVFAGPSGVGKSTLLNAMGSNLDLPTAEVSEKTRKGKHTTSVAVRYEVGPESFVVDTPGIRELGLWGMEPAELYGYFPEMLEPAHDCRFPNCLHDHEPGCGVKVAVGEGTVSQERYASYLNMLDSLRLGTDDVGR